MGQINGSNSVFKKPDYMKRIIKLLAIMAVIMAGALGVTSCTDGYYPPGPVNGYYDPSLVGDWELVQINGYTIRPSQKNYMCFYGGGNGQYYYMQHGFPYAENIYYWCQSNGYGDRTLTITYSDGQVSTMYYWFSGSSLMMQWNTGTQTVTYRYLPVSYVPW